MPDPWNENWSVRPASDDDADGAVDMFNARSQKMYGANQITRDEIHAWWNAPRFDLATDSQIVLDENSRPIAWAHVGNPGEPYVAIGCGVTLHPEVEDVQAIWDRLFAWVIERARDYVPLAPPDARVFLIENANAIDEARRAAVQRAGFDFVRISNTMRIELGKPVPSPAWPEGIRVRTADIDADFSAIVRADMEAFRDHWGHVEQPFEQELEGWRSFVEREGERFDPSLWFLAVKGDEIVGFSVCSDHVADDTSCGYIGGLGVRPAWRKRGIALALLHHTFGEFRRRDFEAVELDMDSENLTGALRLYTKAGMKVIRQTFAYEKELRPGIDLATRK